MPNLRSHNEPLEFGDPSHRILPDVETANAAFTRTMEEFAARMKTRLEVDALQELDKMRSRGAFDQPEPADPYEYLDVQGVRKVLGVGDTKARKLLRQIPRAKRIGNKYMVRRCDLDQYLLENPDLKIDWSR